MNGLGCGRGLVPTHILPALGSRRVIKVLAVRWTLWVCQMVMKPKKFRFLKIGDFGFLKLLTGGRVMNVWDD